MLEYTIIHDTILEILEKKVNQKIKDGWAPTEGSRVFCLDDCEHFYQAMIKN